MKRFKKILVGVDLSWGDRFVCDALSVPNAAAVRLALWLAKANSATIDYHYALDLSPTAQRLFSESNMDESTVLEEAKQRLAQLTEQAREQGVVADSHVVIGKSWLELIRQVARKQHDLVLTGTRHTGARQGALVGSTGIKLLRKCPCAVWVTPPGKDQGFESILVAHDLRPVGDLAMELGCSLAKILDSQLHVVHAAEYPEFDNMFPAMISADHKRTYRKTAEEHIQTQLAGADLTLPAKVHFVTEPPETAIMHCIEQDHVDLVVMGTVGRSGISGFITGNTAERLLPKMPCSLLAVKPPGFVSPVT